jgi:4a-hydroxytetrahydrobiopterin dehydratase
VATVQPSPEGITIGYMAKIMNDSQADEVLRSFTDWHRSDVTIVRTVSLASFPQAIEVVNRVAALAEAADHHPDMDIRWRTLTFRLSTHSEGGLTAKDFALARHIDEVLTAL